ncbi:MAG: hypothetical protein CM1200mP15_01610 [Dehalococcoidia bacterium]|nr:MAG: hypothetical protein CM1200mP15_01610 [Dehalococcoidia bacterium]
MKFGVSLTGMGQQPRGTDMRQSFGKLLSMLGLLETSVLILYTKASTI